MTIFYLAILCVAMSVAAQFLFKAGLSDVEFQFALSTWEGVRSVVSMCTNPFIVGGFVLYGLGAIAWLGVLSQWDVSKAYPIVGLGFVFTLAIGWCIGEQVTLTRAVGVVFVCAGVAIVGRS